MTTTMPQTVQEAGWDMSEVKHSSWGLQPPLRAVIWWSARTINSRGEKLGLVHDRHSGVQTVDGVSEERRKQFDQAVIQVVLPELRKRQELIYDDRVYGFERELTGVGLVRSALRLRGGYGYLCVWVEPDETV